MRYTILLWRSNPKARQTDNREETIRVTGAAGDYCMAVLDSKIKEYHNTQSWKGKTCT
jgi:hypothetical protein